MLSSLSRLKTSYPSFRNLKYSYYLLVRVPSYVPRKGSCVGASPNQEAPASGQVSHACNTMVLRSVEKEVAREVAWEVAWEVARQVAREVAREGVGSCKPAIDFALHE